jgi:Tol biopolymer transport system component
MKRSIIILFLLSLAACSNYDKDKYKGCVYINDQDNICRYAFNKNGLYNRDTVLVFTRNASGCFYGISAAPGCTLVCYVSSENISRKGEYTLQYCLSITNTKTNQTDILIRDTIPLECPSISPDNKNIAFSQKSKCAIYNIATKIVGVWDTYTLTVTPCWAAEGKSLMISTADGEIVRLSLEGKIIERYGSGFGPVISPDGKYIAFTDYIDDHTIYVEDIKTKKRRTVASWGSLYLPHDHNTVYLCWSPDSKYILYQAWTPISRITSWESRYVIVPVFKSGMPFSIAAVTGCGYGASWAAY